MKGDTVMKRILSLLITIIIILSISIGFNSCTKEESRALFIGYGNHRNFAASENAVMSMFDYVYNACYSYGNVTVSVIEGSPKLNANYSIDRPEKSISNSKRKTIAKQRTNGILNECLQMTAESPETDTLATIKLGADTLNGCSCESKIMLIYDNGLCTTGILSQKENDFISANPDDVIRELNEKHCLPDLRGVSIYWTGLGCVANNSKQHCIPDSYKYKLKTLWETIITESGGTVYFTTTPITGEENEALPYVTPISFVCDSLDVNFSSIESLDNPIKFDDTTLKFKANLAEFVNPTEAQDILLPIAELLRQHPECTIMIAGTTASVGDKDNCIELSYKRANACKSILLQNGVLPDQVECTGLGATKNSFHENDLDADGNLVEEIAKINRAIYIQKATP